VVPTDEDDDLLARIDERVQIILERMDGYVTKEEFRPVQRIVYGLVGGVLLTMLGAVIALVIKT